MDEQERNRGWRDTGQPRRLAQGLGPVLAQALARLNTQGRHLQVIELRRQAQALIVRGAAHLLALAVDIARILGSNLHLLHDGQSQQLSLTLHSRLRQSRVGKRAVFKPHQIPIRHAGAAQQIHEGVFVLHGLAQQRHRIRLRHLLRADPGGFQALCFT